MARFTIAQPSTVADAVDLLDRHGMDAAPYAGGTELLLAIREGLFDPEVLIDMKTIDELGHIRLNPDVDALDIGATVTYAQALGDAEFSLRIPLLVEVISRIGNVRVRSSGTPVGNLCFAEPHSDMAAVAALLGARLRLAGSDREWIDVQDFLLAPYETELREGEIVRTLRIPIPPEGSVGAYRRIRGTERPLASVGVLLSVGEDGTIAAARVVIGAIAGRPWTSSTVDEALAGRRAVGGTPDLEDVAALIADEIDADDDYEASALYRRHLAGELFVRAMREAVDRWRRTHGT